MSLGSRLACHWKGKTMKTLPIVWQRLVSSGETCPRCAGTGDEVERAYQQLRQQDQQQIIRFSDSLVRGFSNANPLRFRISISSKRICP